MRSSMSLFVYGLSRFSSKKDKIAMLIGDMDIDRLMMHVQQQKPNRHAPSVASALAPKNRGAILSYFTPYIAISFDINPEKLFEPFNVSTPVAESILAERVYRDCTLFVNHKDTMAVLVKLDVVDFDVILGIVASCLLCLS
ncbi:hypothetical protein H5410_027204 [Solanum commersonii]|uniref:Uncharacterized protein n=1 Tax=Solanum commersonii TaxID=4109 RepID=A0A9J5Z150_SOLCO|nr:hypothetical protein H5410_027204 [Solanum commersonii]